MGRTTSIQYADSSLNLMAGCDGCELWNMKQGVFRCYAGNITQSYAGRPGWPASFNTPTIFPHRINDFIAWKNMAGKKRDEKPWLNGYPRVVFFNDMGDTFTPSLPENWLLEHMQVMEESPHIVLMLTKHPRKMVRFFLNYGSVPSNFWLLTSVTSTRTRGRAADLLLLRERFPDAVLGVSLAPLWEEVDLSWGDFNWVITEGESGTFPLSPSHPDFFRAVRDGCAAAGTPYFHKQNGSWLHQSQLTADQLALHQAAVRMGASNVTLPWRDGTVFYHAGRNGGRLLDGQQHNGMPALRDNQTSLFSQS